MKISIIVATSQNNIIGDKNKIPWRSKEDLKHFKETTSGHHILMGRKTYDSIGKPLPDRTSIVISTNPNLDTESVKFFNNLDNAIKFANERQENELFVIGGQQIYELTLPIAEKIIQTIVLGEYKGDVLFPEIKTADWKEVSREEHLNLNPPIIFRGLERR